jgi:hypothetical protein
VKNSCFTIGFLAIAVQLTFGINTMLKLSADMPFIITIAFCAVVVIVELMKPVTTFFLTDCKNYWARVGAMTLLVTLSCLSIYATHFTMNLTTSKQISETDKAALHNLDLQQAAYLEAVKKGVVSASKDELSNIDAKREGMLKTAYSAPQQWAIIISIMIEVIILAAFAFAAHFSLVKTKEVVQEIEECTVEDENLTEISQEQPLLINELKDGVHKIKISEFMREFNLGYKKAKLIIGYFENKEGR